MKAITLHQPYASAIALGIKHVETRGWRTHHRGPIAIHAASVANLAYRPVFEKCAERATFTAAGYRDFFNLPQGEIVAVAEVEDVVPVEVFFTGAYFTKAQELLGGPAEKRWGDYRAGRFAWVLTNIRRLATPIRVRGAQGLWNWEPPADLRFVSDDPAARLPVLTAYRLPTAIKRPPFATA